jgi:hypothetical protein
MFWTGPDSRETQVLKNLTLELQMLKTDVCQLLKRRTHHILASFSRHHPSSTEHRASLRWSFLFLPPPEHSPAVQHRSLSPTQPFENS